jgi:formylglycine-generating enzyme required for sulfatase activity
LLPVDSPTWLDAVEFCRRLSALPAEKKAKRTYRLPSEAEWEYACRAGTTSPVAFGTRLRPEHANYDPRHASGRSTRHTTPVGSYPANAWGLYDMHGNLWEWCADWFDEDYYAVSPRHDPPGPIDGGLRMLRGGSWFYIASSCRSAIRFGRAPEEANDLVGFRVAYAPG